MKLGEYHQGHPPYSDSGNAQPSDNPGRKHDPEHPELTAEEIRKAQEEAIEERQNAQREASEAFRGFLDAIFDCANSLMKPVDENR
ncbi:hypothetical protein N5V81_13840 [Escherichia coli]|nr:hypothetical protein [Escherichia coli]